MILARYFIHVWIGVERDAHNANINIVPLLENRGKVHHLPNFVELHQSLQKNVSTANSSTF